MKKFMTVAAVVAIAACGGEKKAETPAADTTAAMSAPAAPAPATDSAAMAAPATVDSAAKAAVDSAKH
jgi:hypothetical protein